MSMTDQNQAMREGALAQQRELARSEDLAETHARLADRTRFVDELLAKLEKANPSRLTLWTLEQARREWAALMTRAYND